LFQNHRIIIARAGHPLSGSTTISDLAGASWVTTPVMIDSAYEVNGMFYDAGLPSPHIAMEAASALSILTIVLSTDLLAPMPGQWRKVIEATDFIEEIPIREKTYAPRICAVRPARMPMTPAAEHFNDLVLRAAPHVAARSQPEEADAN
jgi:LysR family transcriptional regulator, regulator of abg operon